MELLLRVHLLAGEDWDSDQATLRGPQLPSANGRIRAQQQKSMGLCSALV